MSLIKAVFIALSVSAFLLVCQGVSAQSSNSIEVIRPQDGLSHREVLCILQSRQGYMWFGTRDGLNRYDGHSILVLNTRSKPVSLSDNEVLQLYEDSKGMIWIMSGRALDRLNPFDFTIRSFTDELQKATGELSVMSIGEKAGHLWGCTALGKLMLIDTSTGRFSPLFNFGVYWPEEGPITNGVRIDSRGNYWAVSSRYGIMKLSSNARPIKTYHVKNKIIAGPYIGAGDAIRICCSDGLFMYDAKLDSFIQIEKERSGSIFSYFLDSNDDTWVVENIYNLYKKEKGKWHQQPALKDATHEKETVINTLYEDLSHNMWVGTTYGVVKMPLRRNVFTSYLNIGADELETKRYSIRGFVEDADGTIWLGSYSGFFHFDPQSSKIVTMPLFKSMQGSPMVLSPYASIDDGDKLWLATEGYGLVQFDKKKQTYTLSPSFRLPRSRGFPYFLISLARDSKGRFWIGSYEGLFFKEKESDSFISCAQLYPGMPLDRGKILAIYELDKDMWVGTDKGLYRMDEQSLKIKTYFSAIGDNRQPLSVRYLTSDVSGNLWIGTAGDGVFQLNNAGAVLRHWTTIDGMSDNTVYAILFDKGRLFCSTNNGITVIDSAKGVFSRFYTEDGLSHNEFNHGSFLKHSSGEMYFGGIDGFNRFRPSDLHNVAKKSLPFLITSYEVFDQNTQSMQTYYMDRSGNLSLELPYGNRSFAVHFALADYTRPQNNKYSYILEGHDKDWVNLDNQPFIRMVDVPPGKYKLRIKALGSDGMWNEKELKVNITAAQVFYRSWWFIGLGILLVSGSAFAFYSYRIRQYRKMLEMRTRLASDLHDEVGSHLTGIALSSDLMKQFPADERIAKLIDRISNSSRQASTKMSDVLWSIDSRSDTLDSLLNRITEHALEIFEPAGIEFAIKTDGLPEHQKLPMNTRHNLYLIFKEATNNIVKHARASKATISLTAKNGSLEMTIADNGTAPPDPERKTGQGLRNMHMRAAQMNGKIEINCENGFRIQVVVKI